MAEEPPRPRPSTVTVIHTGTKWRQVPREVSWETTELWVGLHRGCPARPSRNLPTVSAKPQEELLQFPLPWPSTALRCLTLSPGSAVGRKLTGSHCCGSCVQSGSWSPGWQAAGLESATLKGNSSPKLLSSLDYESPETRTLCCLPCVNIPPGTVEWSHVMQVKYKLHAVVNNRDFICTLDSSSFSTALVNSLWYLLQWLAEWQLRCFFDCFVLKCADRKHERDSIGLFIFLQRVIALFVRIFAEMCKRVIGLERKVVESCDKESVYNSYYFVIADSLQSKFFFDVTVKSSLTTGGPPRVVVVVVVVVLRDVLRPEANQNPSQTTPNGNGDVVYKRNLQVLLIIPMCHWESLTDASLHWINIHWLYERNGPRAQWILVPFKYTELYWDLNTAFISETHSCFKEGCKLTNWMQTCLGCSRCTIVQFSHRIISLGFCSWSGSLTLLFNHCAFIPTCWI